MQIARISGSQRVPLTRTADENKHTTVLQHAMYLCQHFLHLGAVFVAEDAIEGSLVDNCPKLAIVYAFHVA